MKKCLISLALAAMGLMLCGVPMVRGADAQPAETKQERDARMAWWREARFGMFIHWGVYSVPAGTWNGHQIGGIGEWIMHNGRIPVADYKKFAEQFNPVKFDADQWVKTAKDAGMRYIVITSKHHDGFAMFHSRTNPFNIYDATPFKRDPLKELAEACQKQGIKLGFYYSQAQDWTAPGGGSYGGHWDKAQDGSFDKYLDEKAVPQVKEILTNYGPVAVLWFDTPVEMTPQRAEKFIPLFKLQPGIIVNNRLGGGFNGDSETPEQQIPGGKLQRDWETCMTMNDTWGYKSYDNNWKSTETLLRNLIDIASKGGNYLLNVGPTSEGLMPAPSVERLKQVGQWMKVNGEAIYGTQANPFGRPPAWGRITQKPGKLFLHVFNWPKDGHLDLAGLGTHVGMAYLLADPDRKMLNISGNEELLKISLPEKAPDPIASVVVLECTGDIKVAAPRAVQQADGKLSLLASEAVIHGQTAQLEGSGDGNIGYWLNPHDFLTWDVKIDHPGTFGVTLNYACNAGSGGSEFVVAAGDQQLAGKVEATGSWANYQSVDLGKLTIAKAGPMSIELKPKNKPGEAVMNLRSIVLTPTDK